jgi:hypothetical protein
MQPPRFAPTLVLSTVILFACDPEQDLPDDVIADELELGSDDGEPVLGDLPAELVELELEAPSNEQTTEESAACSISGVLPGPSYLLVNQQNIATTEISISVPQTAFYDFNVTLSYPPYLSSFEIQKQWHPYHVVNSDTQNVGYPFIGHDQETFDVTLQAPANAVPGSSYGAMITLYSNEDECPTPAHHWVYVRIPDCTSVGWWATGAWPTPGFDNANCYVMPLPQGQQSFVWNNGWYVKPTNGNQCAIGVFDSVNCYIGSAPNGHTAFIWNNILYFTP